MERNIARLADLTEEAARGGARLIVHPEMATTGYCWASRDEIAPYVEAVPGPTTDCFGAIAARFDCYIVAAIAEIVPATGIYYNSAVLIGPRGVIGVYRKTHAYISEPKWAKDGDLGLPVFDTELGKIAITICMDATFPESARVPALAGADVICFPTNWLGEPCPSPCWMARALENGVFFIAANRYGLERGVQFCGGSCVISPDGSIESMLRSGDGIVYGTVDPMAARDHRWAPDRAEDKMADRRPDAYGSITLNTYRWQDRDFHGLYDLSPLPPGRISDIVVAQFSPQAGDVDANLASIESIARRHAGAGLIVFPELAATGPVAASVDARAMAAQSERIAAALAQIAAQFGSPIVCGLVEADGDRLFNAAIVVGPNGIVGTYRKVHLTSDDRRWAEAGNALQTFDLPAGRVGVAIGYDAAFPETTTCLAVDGADVIACPSLVSWPAVRGLDESAADPSHFHLWRERARETNTMIAFANGASPALGWSGIFGAAVEDDPTQQVMIAGSAPGSAALALDTTNLDTRFVTNSVRAKETIAMRVPIWYDAIQAPHPAATGRPRSELLVSQTSDD
jgi:predicted amidohydrolase